jgi:serine/threonine-protein kinase
MRRILLVCLMLVVTASAADARHRGRHGHYYPYDADRTVGMAPDTMPEDRSYDRRSRRDRAERRDSRERRDADDRMVPSSWHLQAPDPSWHGKRYLSPDGSAWYASYESPPDKSATDHMKTIAFGDGEEITYLRGERGMITVSGTKADRIFYRKAVLDCGGRLWRHIAFEYPTDAKRAMDGFVTRAAAMLERPSSDACDAAVSAKQ